ncbi:MAG: copper chaperone PCu(A)C [Gammaproteobacteria bacterium]|nr:copper chaperone PCu(A)C [Gammaproteobacteria bacterium]
MKNQRITTPSRRLIAAILLGMAGTAWSQVAVSDAWVRATVPGQQATGMFANLTAKQDSKLVGGSSPVAGTVEVHEMKMEGDVMKMRAVASLPLPAGQAVSLKPGSYHIMLMGLKKPLPDGSTVPIKLVVEDAQKKQTTIDVKVPVKKMGPATEEHGHDHDHGHGHHKH